MRQHRRAERRRVAALPACRRGLQARRTVRRRAASGPARAISISSDVLAAKRRRRGLGEPRRDADAQAAGDELQQRPAAGLVERVEPACELRRQLRLAERGQCCRRPRDKRRRSFGALLLRVWPATSARRFRTGRRHSRRTAEQHRVGALGDQRADHAGLGVLEDSAPVSAASAQPRSGSACRAK